MHWLVRQRGSIHPDLRVVARTAFAAGKIAEQVFDCHWSDLDIRLVP